MTRPLRYFFRIAVFLACVAAGAALLWQPLYAAFFYNPLLNGLISGILIIGIVWNIVIIFRLIPEIRWVETLKQTRTSLAGTAPPRLLAPLATALMSYRHHNEKPAALSAQTAQALLDSVSGRLEEGREVSRYMTSLLIFLGLLGTFYGLLLTVASIADVISGMSVNGNALDSMFEQLKTNLARPLHGMSTAFSGSLFGLAGALILGFLDLTAGQAQNRFFNELEEWMAEHTGFNSEPPALAHTAPAYTQALLEQTAENLASLQNLIRSCEVRREQEMAQLTRLTENLQHTTGQTEILRNIEHLLRSVAQSNIEGRNEISAEIKDGLRILARTVRAETPSHSSQDKY